MAKFDERLYTLIRSLPDVAALIQGRMYHIEVLQSTAQTPKAKYPCIAYQLVTDTRIGDLAGNRTGSLRRAQFQFLCFATNSADIRTIAKAINDISQDVPTATGAGFEWLEVEDTTDDYEVPFEYDEKAMKYVNLDVYVLYREE